MTRCSYRASAARNLRLDFGKLRVEYLPHKLECGPSGRATTMSFPSQGTQLGLTRDRFGNRHVASGFQKDPTQCKAETFRSSSDTYDEPVWQTFEQGISK